ncbi:MAG: BlaI/MecI/CopY family transcriptional regulator [Planctomycetaceae bacterium]|nr:BlaI/MecI/CopY family transcriptional regulator [Planctomycetaceae bacterium]
MTANDVSRPTDAELEILKVLWERGTCTVRDVFEVLSAARETGYTTTLKLLQIMFEKGLVSRDESQKSHVYKARAKQQATQRMLVTDLLTRAFGGSTEKLVVQALAAKKASKEELAEIRRLLNELEGDEQ